MPSGCANRHTTSNTRLNPSDFFFFGDSSSSSASSPSSVSSAPLWLSPDLSPAMSTETVPSTGHPLPALLLLRLGLRRCRAPVRGRYGRLFPTHRRGSCFIRQLNMSGSWLGCWRRWRGYCRTIGGYRRGGDGVKMQPDTNKNSNRCDSNRNPSNRLCLPMQRPVMRQRLLMSAYRCLLNLRFMIPASLSQQNFRCLVYHVTGSKITGQKNQLVIRRILVFFQVFLKVTHTQSSQRPRTEPRLNNDVNRECGTDRASRRWLRDV